MTLLTITCMQVSQMVNPTTILDDVPVHPIHHRPFGKFWTREVSQRVGERSDDCTDNIDRGGDAHCAR